MANTRMTVDSRQLKKWANYTKLKRPSQAKAIMRETLNDQAFYARKAAREKTMPGMFNIRNKWALNSILVNKANSKQKNMYSTVGAAKRWRMNKSRDFYGLRDQEFGKTIRDPWVHTLYSRGGDVFGGTVKKKYRKHAITNATRISFTRHGKIIQSIRNLDARGHKGLINITKGSDKLEKGIYVFGKKATFRDSRRGARVGGHRSKVKRRVLRKVVDVSKGTVRIPRRPWLSKATKMVTNKKTMVFFRRAWAKYTTERGK